jgi:hypothetical protein
LTSARTSKSIFEKTENQQGDSSLRSLGFSFPVAFSLLPSIVCFF